MCIERQLTFEQRICNQGHERIHEHERAGDGAHAGPVDRGSAVRGRGDLQSRDDWTARPLSRLAAQAVDYPEDVFTNLAHLIDEDFLREAYRRTRKDSAPGIDRVTAKEYAEHLDENLRDLHERLG